MFTVIEMHSNEWYKPFDPIQIHTIKRFKYKADAIEYFFKPRKKRDFCYGLNFIHNEDTITIYEYDELGTSTFILEKWPDFDDDYVFTYVVKENGAETKMNWRELNEYLKNKNAYVYWADDTYGRYGSLRNNEDQEIGSVISDLKYNVDFNCQ